jgi:hypothetical protein
MRYVLLSWVSSIDSAIDIQTLVLDLLATIYGVTAVGLILASLSAIAWLCHSEARRPPSRQAKAGRRERVTDGLTLEESADLASV